MKVPTLEELGSLSSELAFTGRSDKLTFQQWDTLDTFLAMPELHWFVAVHNNGDGADNAFNNLCTKYAFRSILADPHDPSLGHMAKNRALVARAGVLIAAPPTHYVTKTGSGTWETVKYGWKKGIPVWIIWPNGAMERHTKDSCPQEPSAEERVQLIKGVLMKHEETAESRTLVNRAMKALFPSVAYYANRPYVEKCIAAAEYLAEYPQHRLVQQLIAGENAAIHYTEVMPGVDEVTGLVAPPPCTLCGGRTTWDFTRPYKKRWGCGKCNSGRTLAE